MPGSVCEVGYCRVGSRDRMRTGRQGSYDAEFVDQKLGQWSGGEAASDAAVQTRRLVWDFTA
jgi:hypothetical protein